MLSDEERRGAADALGHSRSRPRPIGRLTESGPTSTSTTRTRSSCSTSAAAATPARVVRGHKVGLSSQGHAADDGRRRARLRPPARRHVVFEDGRVAAADATATRGSRSRWRSCSARPARGPGCTEADVLPGHRVRARRRSRSSTAGSSTGGSSCADTIADNASSAGFVLGASPRCAPATLDVRDRSAPCCAATARSSRPGGSGAVLGNPATAVAWLANKVAALRRPLEAGHVILPGSCTRAVDVAPGDEFRAEFAGLGHVVRRLRRDG